MSYHSLHGGDRTGRSFWPEQPEFITRNAPFIPSGPDLLSWSNRFGMRTITSTPRERSHRAGTTIRATIIGPSASGAAIKPGRRTIPIRHRRAGSRYRPPTRNRPSVIKFQPRRRPLHRTEPTGVRQRDIRGAHVGAAEADVGGVGIRHLHRAHDIASRRNLGDVAGVQCRNRNILLASTARLSKRALLGSPAMIRPLWCTCGGGLRRTPGASMSNAQSRAPSVSAT